MSRHLFDADVVEILSPHSADLRISIGFGVEVRRDVKFDSAISPPIGQWDHAKKAVILLIGGKSVKVQVDPNEVSPLIGRVFVKVKNPHPVAVELIGRDPWMDVSKFLNAASRDGFSTVVDMATSARRAEGQAA